MAGFRVLAVNRRVERDLRGLVLHVGNRQVELGLLDAAVLLVLAAGLEVERDLRGPVLDAEDR